MSSAAVVIGALRVKCRKPGSARIAPYSHTVAYIGLLYKDVNSTYETKTLKGK